MGAHTCTLVQRSSIEASKSVGPPYHCTKNEFFIVDFFSKCDQICMQLRHWSHLLKNSLMENFIFCAVYNHSLTHPIFVRGSMFSGRLRRDHWCELGYLRTNEVAPHSS